MLRLLFLVAHTLVVVAHALWHGLCEGLFESRHDLSGAVAGCANDGELRRLIFVETGGELRACRAAHGSDGAERNPIAIGRSYVELADVFDVRARRALGLDVGLPLAAEAVEVVHQIPAHESLHGGVHVAELNLLLLDLLAIDIDVELRYLRIVGRDGRRNLGPVLQGAEKLIGVGGKEVEVVAAGAIFEHKAHAARTAETRNRRWREGERQTLFHPG